MTPRDLSPPATTDKPALICLSHLRWDFVTQRPQHLMDRFARDYRVLFWEEAIPTTHHLPIWSSTPFTARPSRPCALAFPTAGRPRIRPRAWWVCSTRCWP